MPFYNDLKYYRDNPDPTYSDKHKWIAERLLALRYDLDMTIVKDRRPNSLIVGTWNIRAFDGGLPRLDESLHYIAEIIATFDVCALQELKPNLEPIRRLKTLLGPNWDYFLTDVCDHEGGNAERMAFFYNTDKVFFRNIIGEIVVFPRTRCRAATRSPARRSSLLSRRAGSASRSARRISSTATTSRSGRRRSRRSRNALAKRAKVEDQVFIFLGDMNIESNDGPIMAALRNSEMDLAPVPPSNLGGDKPYDQIAYTMKGKSTRKTRLLRSGGFDWRNAVFGPALEPDPDAPDDPEYVIRKTDDENAAHYGPIVAAHRKDHGKKAYADFRKAYKQWTTHEMSDHLPVWVELETDYSDQYLMKFT